MTPPGDSPTYRVKKAILGHEVQYECPHCEEALSSELVDAGSDDTCPHCGGSFVVPGTPERERLAAEQAAKQEERRRLAAEQAAKEAAQEAVHTENVRQAKIMRQRVVEQSKQQARRQHRQSLGALVIGVPLAVLGGCIGAFFLFAYPVTAPESDTLNLGLLNDRLCGVVVGASVAMVGGVFLAAHHIAYELIGCFNKLGLRIDEARQAAP